MKITGHNDEPLFAEYGLSTSTESQSRLKSHPRSGLNHRYKIECVYSKTAWQMPLVANCSIYVASRTIHAEKWLQLREEGWPIISTWIDEAGYGQSSSYLDLAIRCVSEASLATHFLLYCEPGEFLKGALIEVGAALAHMHPVFVVGECQSTSRVFEAHPLWYKMNSLREALLAIQNSSSY